MVVFPKANDMTKIFIGGVDLNGFPVRLILRIIAVIVF